MVLVTPDTQMARCPMMRAIMSLSGGMDSTALLMNLLSRGYDVSCLSFEYGQKHRIEVERAKSNISYLKENGFLVDHRVINLESAMGNFASSLTDPNEPVPEGHYESEQMKLTVVPNRNAIFSSILYGHAISIAKTEDCVVAIALGVHSGDHEIYPDCRPEFYEALGMAFEIGNWGSERVSFLLPYINENKESILKDAMNSSSKLNLNFDIVFSNTITSYEPDVSGKSSGKTGSDIERILAFHSIGKRDPIEYTDDWETVLRNALEVQIEYGDRK